MQVWSLQYKEHKPNVWEIRCETDVQYIIRTTPPLKGQLTFKLCGKKFWIKDLVYIKNIQCRWYFLPLPYIYFLSLFARK